LSPRTWRRIRQGVQILALLLFLFLIFYANAQRPGPFWADLFSRLDPLLMIAASVAGRLLVSGLLLAGIILLLTLIFGRVWCGWLCPLGTILEWLGPRRSSRRPPPESWRAIKYLLLFAILFAALLGNQTLVVLDPITIFNRTLTTAVWPAVRYSVVAVEGFLYQFPILWGPLDAVHANLIQPLFLGVQPLFATAALVALLFAGLVALNWWAPRFWCRYLCPLGGLLGLVSKLSLLRREVDDDCVQCARCGRECPTGTIDPADNYRSDPAECIVCYDCLVDCPQASLGFRWQVSRARGMGWQPAAWRTYDPSRRQALAALGASAAGVALVGLEPITLRQPATMIRPPGALRMDSSQPYADFGALCARCGACVRACPTQGLQPSLFEGGAQNLLTPRLVPRLGYCNFGCNACGQVCPTGAIPKLDLADKQQTTIGLASINQDRCLPWAYNIPCIVCEEACPIENKAIRLEEIDAVNTHGEQLGPEGFNGEPARLQRPRVIQELCIGCGICEYQCPVGGEGAIRVYTPTLLETTAARTPHRA
jgi:polyferredoxin